MGHWGKPVMQVTSLAPAWATPPGTAGHRPADHDGSTRRHPMPDAEPRRTLAPTRPQGQPGRPLVQTILVANPKGGSGKTTLATNIAGWLAGKRQKVALADADPQHSSAQWLSRRPALFPKVEAADGESRRKDLDRDVQWLVIDSAAGVHGEALRDGVRRADIMLVPVSPSAFDIAAT